MIHERGSFMRIAAVALLLGLSSLPALAADTEGTITAVDQEAMTITLEDGATYKLPAEIDLSAISDGMEVVIAYQVNENGERQITDMLLPE
jgi:cell division septal protein FtsQ